jgi:hypothetical protein
MTSIELDEAEHKKRRRELEAIYARAMQAGTEAHINRPVYEPGDKDRKEWLELLEQQYYAAKGQQPPPYPIYKRPTYIWVPITFGVLGLACFLLGSSTVVIGIILLAVGLFVALALRFQD